MATRQLTFLFGGMNNRVDAAQIAPVPQTKGQLYDRGADLVNVDIDGAGRARRRLGYRMGGVAAGSHSLYGDGKLCLLGRGRELWALGADLQQTQLASFPTASRLHFAPTPVGVMVTSPDGVGLVDENGYEAFPVPPETVTSFGGEVTVPSYKVPLPGGSFGCWYGGLFYVLAELGGESWLYHTDGFSLFMDKRRNFFRFPGKPTLLAASDDGLYIGSGDKLRFLPGDGPDSFGEVISADFPVTPYCFTSFLPEELGMTQLAGRPLDGERHVVAMFGPRGFALGLAGGALREACDEIAAVAAASGTLLVRERDGEIHLVAALGDGEAWVMNSRSLGVSRYDHYPMLGLAQGASGYLGIDGAALYALDAGDDAGVPIASRCVSAVTDYASPGCKHIEDLYLTARCASDLIVTVTVDEVCRRDYPSPGRLLATLVERRIKLARGIEGERVQVEFANVDGCDFEVEGITLPYVPMQRHKPNLALRTRMPVSGRFELPPVALQPLLAAPELFTGGSGAALFGRFDLPQTLLRPVALPPALKGETPVSGRFDLPQTLLRPVLVQPQLQGAVTSGRFELPPVALQPALVAPVLEAMLTGNGGQPWRQQYQFNLTQNSSVSGWTAGTALPGVTGLNAAVATRDYVYLFGGYTHTPSPATLNKVYRAPVNADGSLGAWSQQTNLPVTLFAPAAVIIGNYIYLIGGETADTVYSAAVYCAPIDGSGNIGAWTNTNKNLPATMITRAIVLGSRLYVIGGKCPTVVKSVYYIDINPDGTLGANWIASGDLPTPQATQQVFRVGRRVYSMGGYNASSVYLKAAYSAKIMPDGSLGAWEVTGSASDYLAVSHAACVVTRGRVYVFGGGVSGSATTAVCVSAPIDTDDMLGAWTTMTNLPAGRYAGSIVVTSSRVYILGGNTTGGGTGYTASVVYAPFAGGSNNYMDSVDY